MSTAELHIDNGWYLARVGDDLFEMEISMRGRTPARQSVSLEGGR
jgi:hypothetical protein